MSQQIFQKYTDEELVAGCIRGEAKFQHLMYHRLCDKMYSVCLRFAKEPSSAQDLLQDGFVKLYQNVGKFRGEGSFEGWARRIFVNNAIEHFRKKVNMYAIVDNTMKSCEYHEAGGLDNLKADDIMKLVQSLSDGYRMVFNLYVIEGYSHKEIGDMLKISEGTSKSQLARARYLLQEMVVNVNKVAKTQSAS